MDVERQLGGPSAGFDDRRAHRQVGDEVPVHHVDVDPIGPAVFRPPEGISQVSEIRGQDGSGQDRSLGHVDRIIPSCQAIDKRRAVREMVG